MLLLSAALLRSALLLSAGALLSASAWAQPQQGASNTGSIFVCVDASGRTVTSDRLIAACLDREQREISPNGNVRRVIEPTLTADEQAAREARQREAQQAAARVQEERRRERALLVRYPNADAHERERSEALAHIDELIKGARNRLVELVEARKQIDGEMEFYAKDPSRAPNLLRRRIEDHDKAVAVQSRFIREQEEEKRRVNQRFDDERARLVKLWAVSR